MSHSDEYLENLILSGAVEFAGINSESGEIMYSFSQDLQNINPDLYNALQRDIEREIYVLWEKGFLNMNISEDNPSVTLTNKALNEDAIRNELSVEERQSLNILKSIMID